MLVAILLIMLVASLVGIALIIRRKIPLLLELSLDQASFGVSKKAKNKAEKKYFSREVLLDRVLIRVLFYWEDSYGSS